MEYCGVFGPSTSQHSCIGYEETPYGSATPYFVGGTGTTYVTPQGFAEMPTPSSWHGTDVITPGYWNCGYVHQNPIQSSCEQNSEKQTRHSQDNQSFLDMLAQAKAQLETISEKLKHAIVQNSRGTIWDCIENNDASKLLLAREAIKEFQEMPMSDDYDEGTKSLPNEVIFLSENTIEQQKNEDQRPIYDDDETEGDLNESVCVIASNTEKQPYEEDSACPSITTDLRHLPLELQQQDDEKACNCPVLKASDSVVTSSSQLNSEHSMRELRLLWDPGVSLPFISSKMQHLDQVLQLSPNAAMFACSSVFSGCKCMPFSPSCSQNNISLFWASENGSRPYFYWDPGILKIKDTMLSKTAVPNLMDLKHFLAPLLLQYHSGCTISNVFLQDQYCCLPTVLDCLYSEPVKQLVCYSSMISSTAICMSNPTTLRMRLVLKSGKVAQEGRDASAVQLPVRINSHIWDPGIDSLLFLHKLLHIHLIQLLDSTSTTTYACYFFVDARLPATLTQGVKKNYSAKKLLSSPNYYQILEMDIIFTTYLPP